MPEKQPQPQEPQEPAPEATLTYTDFNALHDDVAKEHKAARRHRAAATFFGAVGVAGFFLVGDAIINRDHADNMGVAVVTEALAAFWFMNQLDEARKRQRRATKLDDAIFKALEKSQVNLAAVEDPRQVSDPASYDIHGQAATENVVATVVRLNEILHANGIDISALQQLAPIAEPPTPPEHPPQG